MPPAVLGQAGAWPTRKRAGPLITYLTGTSMDQGSDRNDGLAHASAGGLAAAAAAAASSASIAASPSRNDG
jgi:hypothetical protein